MSSNSFAVSMGLAAIDGLLCAFVAMLMLALVLIGPGIATSAPDLTQAQALWFRITKADEDTKGIDLNLLVDIRADGSGDVGSLTVESGGRMTRLKGLIGQVQDGGEIWWKDCQVLAGKECPAALFVTRIKPGQRWRVRLRVADAADSFTAGGSSYTVYAKLVPGVSGASLPNLALTPDLSVQICVDWDKKTLDPKCK
jgi:hypothetical protein